MSLYRVIQDAQGKKADGKFPSQKGENVMFASVLSASIQGMEVCPIHVEADVSDGLPTFVMVGFASAQVKEAQDRVRTALKNNEISLPPKRITINMAPADIRKEGSGFDLPIAAALLAASGILTPDLLQNTMLMGELSLNGEIHPITGVLPRVIYARETGCRFCMIPYGNLREACLVKDMKIIGVRTLKEMIRYLRHPEKAVMELAEEALEMPGAELLDFAEVAGQESARRAAEIAVAGFHNLLMIGPPGAGKTMIARRIPTIMPPLTFEESLELTKIYSIAGLLSEKSPLIRKRPFRSPHHTSTALALTGGGRNPRPGEVTLAHRGVLFLDEMPEFSRRSLETLRQPLEDKMICLSRASGSYRFPANFMLVAAMNPCPCGFYPDMNRCHCSPGEVTNYLGKLSQPLLDRIDLCVDIPAVSLEELVSKNVQESSAEIRERIQKAQRIQQERYQDETTTFNGELSGRKIQQYCEITKEAENLLERAFQKMQFSVRSYHKVLKVARTIADLRASDQVDIQDLAEALSYRAFDKKYRG